MSAWTPRRRAMFKGAPGTGKTTLAHHMAARLGLPMLKVRAEKVQSQYVGESAIKVGRLFDLVQSVDSPMVLFFDEFRFARLEAHGQRPQSGRRAGP